MFNTWFIQRHKVNKRVFWRWFMKHLAISRGKNSVYFRSERNGHKPHLQVLIYPGKPSARLGLGGHVCSV